MPTVMFADIPLDAIFGDGKEGLYRKVAAFSAPPAGFRSHPEANAIELDPTTLNETGLAWFADDCDELVYPLSPEPGAKLTMTSRIEVNAPKEVRDSLVSLQPRLEGLGVTRLDVFAYGRPGEPRYWVAFLITKEGRHTVGTTELRHLALEDQLPDILRQLANWPVGDRPDKEAPL